MKPIHPLHPSERGQLAIMLAIMLVLILGTAALVMDLGVYYQEKANMQHVTDAAALAAAVQLPDNNAANSAALQVTTENGYVVGERGVVSIDFLPNPDGTHPARYLVRMRRNMPPYLSRILGHRGTLLETQAVAQFMVKGIAPWMFFKHDIDTLVYGNEYILKQGPFGAETGNFNCVQLTGPGAACYLKDLKFGYDGYLTLGETLQTETGNMAGPTKTGVDYRLNSPDPEDRIVLVPATNDLPPNGTGPVTIHGFAAFRLEQATKVGNDCYVRAVLVNYRTLPWTHGGAGLRTCLIR
jgi:hypothetical protein